MKTWTSTSLEKNDQFDSWCSELGDLFGRWQPSSQPTNSGFFASTSILECNNAKFIECICAPCGAQKTGRDIRVDERHTATIQWVKSGKEYFEIQGKQYVLGAGDVLLWNDTKLMKFEVVETLHKVSITFPLERLRAWLPRKWHVAPSFFPHNTPTAMMLGSIVGTTLELSKKGCVANGDAIVESLLGAILGVTDFDHVGDFDNSMKVLHLKRVKNFIDANLMDTNLCPLKIATENSISVRYLHSLFSHEQQSLNSYIIDQRLDRSRQDLVNPLMIDRTVTEIAYSWGFQSSAHFSRRFKSAYGASPIDYRRSHLSG